MSLNFLSRNLAIPPWLIVIAFVVTTVGTALIVGRITKHSNIHTELTEQEKSPGCLVKFKHHVSKLDQRATSNDVSYTAKLRIVLENQGEQPVQVLAPSWTTGPGNVSVQCGAAIYPGVEYKPGMLGFGHQYQLEEFKGGWKSGKWRQLPNGKDDERLELFVEPGWSFRIWIGLNPMLPHAVLEKKIMTKSLGKLTLPVDVGGRKYDWSLDL